MPTMTLQEFEDKIQKIRAENGWIVRLECRGIWLIKIFDKESEELLAHTGATGLNGVCEALKIPFDRSPWV